MNNQYWAYLLLAIICILLLKKVHTRLRLSFAKHPSLRGHAKMSRRMAKILWYFEYDETHFFTSDQAPKNIVNKRKEGFNSLEQFLSNQMAKTIAFSNSLESSVSDVHFTSAYKVPFPYRQHLSKAFKLLSLIHISEPTRPY